MNFLVSLEANGFSQWVREADSLFAFPGILLLHTIGMGLAVGVSAVFGLRVLGFAPAVRLRAIERFFPLLWTGFWINVFSGAILLAANATKLTRNPDFYVKLLLIALAVVTSRLLRKEALAQDDSSVTPRAKLLAVMSLLFWLGAITAGRLLAYVGRSYGVL